MTRGEKLAEGRGIGIQIQEKGKIYKQYLKKNKVGTRYIKQNIREI